MTRKFSLLTAVAIPLIPVATMFACGGDDGNKITVKPDAAGSGSGSGSGSQTVCPAANTYASLTSFTMPSYLYRTAGSGSSAPNLKQDRFTGFGSDMVALRVILFAGCGSGSGSGVGCPFTTNTWPTTFTPVSGIDLATNEDALVLLLANLSNNTFQDLYLATAGTLNVTSVANGSGQTYAANGLNVETVHLNADGTDVNADGCESTITNFMFSGSATAQVVANGKANVEIVNAGPNEEALRTFLHNRHQ